jgi:aspartate carbamoyltransferase catalytic subunit
LASLHAASLPPPAPQKKSPHALVFNPHLRFTDLSMVDHLLGIKGLSKADIYRYLDTAQSFVEVSQRDIKKVPTLRGKTVVHVFFEPSTRTLASFDIAGKRLSADTINVSASSSSVKKGETLLDTVRTLESMNPDVLVMRHSESGAAHFAARHLTRASVVNAGDGAHEHPTQALLDLLTLRQYFSAKERPIEGLKIGFVGDLRHSRVARSNIWAHCALGNQVRLIGPRTLVPQEFVDAFDNPALLSVHHDLGEGLAGLDVVVCLRMQLERQDQHFVPNLDEYSREYCVSERLLASLAPKSVVLHPGPMNRGLEIAGEVADGPRSLISKQVNNGVAVRMAVLYLLARTAESREGSAAEGATQYKDD